MIKTYFKIFLDGQIKSITKRQLEELVEIEYLTALTFDNLHIKDKIEKKCISAARYGYMQKEHLWFGAYYENEINTHSVADVYLKWIDPVKEFGLYANADIKKHTYMGEYTGCIRKYKKKIDDRNAYCFEYSIGSKTTPYTIDAREKGSLIRFVNHSDSPNLSPLSVYQNGVMHIIFRTNRDVKKNEELTYDYGPNYWKRREKPRI
jgi:hypothetical protein